MLPSSLSDKLVLAPRVQFTAWCLPILLRSCFFRAGPGSCEPGAAEGFEAAGSTFPFVVWSCFALIFALVFTGGAELGSVGRG